MAFSFIKNNTKAKNSSSYEPLTVLQILWTALQLPTKVTTLFFPLLLISILSSTSILLYFAVTISPPLHDLLSKLCILFKDPRGPAPPDLYQQIHRDLKDFAKLAAVISPLSVIATILLSVSTVYTFASAYTNKELTPKALVLRVIRRSYKTLITCSYLLLFGIGYAIISAVVIGTSMLVSSSPESMNITTVSTGTSLTSLAVFLSLYLATRGSMSVVITVVEETWGIGALSWSVELFIGNKQRGTLLTSILMGVRAAIYGALYMVIRLGPPKPMDEQTKLVILVAAAVALWELYSMAAYTVFYYECRKSHGLEVGEEQQGFVYGSLPSSVVVVNADAVY